MKEFEAKKEKYAKEQRKIASELKQKYEEKDILCKKAIEEK